MMEARDRSSRRRSDRVAQRRGGCSGCRRSKAGGNPFAGGAQTTASAYTTGDIAAPACGRGYTEPVRLCSAALLLLAATSACKFAEPDYTGRSCNIDKPCPPGYRCGDDDVCSRPTEMTLEVDASTPMDATVDATVGADAALEDDGAVLPDAAEAADAGPEAPDAGPPPFDAGPPIHALSVPVPLRFAGADQHRIYTQLQLPPEGATAIDAAAQVAALRAAGFRVLRIFSIRRSSSPGNDRP